MIYKLDDLDTAFPRQDCWRGCVTFANGYILHFNTNTPPAEYRALWMGATVDLCFYRKDKFTRRSSVVKITFRR